MLNFWNTIVETNTFNFIVLVAIFAVLYQKLDVSSKLEALKQNISDFIEKSKQEKENSEVYLKNAQNEVMNLDSEIKTKLDKATELAQNVFDEIHQMANKSIEKLEKNVDNVIENEARKINTKLTNETADSAIQLATQKLKEKFTQEPQLHTQYINESIETLDRINL